MILTDSPTAVTLPVPSRSPSPHPTRSPGLLLITTYSETGCGGTIMRLMGRVFGSCSLLIYSEWNSGRSTKVTCGEG